jgi:hypothetical protein
MNDFWKYNICYNLIKKNWNIKTYHEDQYEIINFLKKLVVLLPFTTYDTFFYKTCCNLEKS